MKKVQSIRNMEIQKLWSYAILTATTIVFAIHSPFIVSLMSRGALNMELNFLDNTAELQRLEHLWNYKKMLEIGVCRAYQC